MRPFLRALLKAVGLAVPTVQAGSDAAAQPPSTQIETGASSAAMERGGDGSMVELVKALAHDPALRRRFAADPEAVFRERNIAPNAFRLPEGLDEATVDRILATWTGPVGPRVDPAEASSNDGLIAMSGPVAVYGPPPAPVPTPPKPRDQVVPPEPEPEPVPPPVVQPAAPVPLYGPPPTPEPEPVPPNPPSPAPVYGPPPGFPRR